MGIYPPSQPLSTFLVPFWLALVKLLVQVPVDSFRQQRFIPKQGNKYFLIIELLDYSTTLLKHEHQWPRCIQKQWTHWVVYSYICTLNMCFLTLMESWATGGWLEWLKVLRTALPQDSNLLQKVAHMDDPELESSLVSLAGMHWDAS